MIYSGDTKDLSALLSHNPSPVIIIRKLCRGKNEGLESRTRVS